MAKVLRPDGTVRVRIIGPGKGSSATYEAAQLQRDRSVFRGAQIFWDHPSTREERERPERSLRDLCAVASDRDPDWEDNGPAGPGLYTDAKVFAPYRPLLEEMGPHIGVSIRAAGSVVTKTIGGESVRVAEKFTSGGFDFVTKAGAGGTVVPLSESARPGISSFVEAFLAAHPQESETSESARAQFIEWATGNASPEEDNSMELKEAVAALEASKAEVATLKEENKRLAETLVLREAQDIVTAEIAKETTLPEITRTRLVESLKTQTPLKEGKLDAEALKATIAQRVKDEKAYVEALKPQKITGMGAPADDVTAGKQRLYESMKAMHLANHRTPEDADRLAKISAGL